jgi:hypothetical protein
MTNRIVELGGNWTLLDAPIKSPATPASLSRKGWIACRVPGGVYDALIRAGRLPEPLIGLNSFKCKWIESRAWWFKRTFSLPAGTLRADAIELELDGLDANAVIVLNGTENRAAIRQRGDEDHRTALSLCDHVLRRQLRAVKAAHQVDIDRPLKRLGGHRHDVLEGADPRIVNQDVNTAELRDDRRHHGVDRYAIRNIAGQADRVGRPSPLDLLRGFIGPSLVEVRDYNLRGVIRKDLRDAKADALASTRNDNDFRFTHMHRSPLSRPDAVAP